MTEGRKDGGKKMEEGGREEGDEGTRREGRRKRGNINDNDNKKYTV